MLIRAHVVSRRIVLRERPALQGGPVGGRRIRPISRSTARGGLHPPSPTGFRHQSGSGAFPGFFCVRQPPLPPSCGPPASWPWSSSVHQVSRSAAINSIGQSLLLPRADCSALHAWWKRQSRVAFICCRLPLVSLAHSSRWSKWNFQSIQLHQLRQLFLKGQTFGRGNKRWRCLSHQNASVYPRACSLPNRVYGF